ADPAALAGGSGGVAPVMGAGAAERCALWGPWSRRCARLARPYRRGIAGGLVGPRRPTRFQPASLLQRYFHYALLAPKRVRGRTDDVKCQQPTYAVAAKKTYSITSSARASTEAGTSMPSAFAVLRLITNWYFVGACTGRLAGFSPLRMRS